jgi:hypothetical protein
MRRLLCMVVLLLTGCQTFVGPLQRRGQPQVRVDDPRVSLEEQQKRAREYLAVSVADPSTGSSTNPSPAPSTYTEYPGAGPHYR